ncbi:hypothetical protein DTO013E5_1224 [Penicillium roqueforti]|uniref:uncharacterized protein n=1 Tax=Penicillium roqueforti TaxID=5082 RepID=UPI00190B37A4|nr:uncharacterized protein LCP9604111_2338 [Penicillium roqueforti]KAF9252342.1 hypothetical protein LCP9604111_2338 [Penicillium roqueforti]KAI1837612.1 hypothetical protein CBS147337_1895 [Penicillium roqueforti]KAI2682470.1 hypothetical protein LCP963914a_6358 [Penicillium roqueforti]KAI2689769.1 hypothetical protein CBS147355_220 [Penicillium roqueforti]KAI2702117.1 hypothetical protein CBS147372_3850 [Penicillium roqueforti]
MAWHLLQVSKDIEEYTMSSDLHNFHRTRRYRGELNAMLELDIPLDNIFHPRPQLMSWRNKLDDKFDRYWTILGKQGYHIRQQDADKDQTKTQPS